MSKQYPWAHLFSNSEDFPDDDEEIIDIVEVSETKKKLAAEVENSAKTHKTIQDLKTVSKQAFDQLGNDIMLLKAASVAKTAEIDALKRQVTELTAELEQVRYEEILPVVLTQSVLSHSRSLNTKETQDKILAGVHKWLKQRSKVVNYLKTNGLFEDQVAPMSSVLHSLKKAQLTKLVSTYTIRKDMPLISDTQ